MGREQNCAWKQFLLISGPAAKKAGNLVLKETAEGTKYAESKKNGRREAHVTELKNQSRLT